MNQNSGNVAKPKAGLAFETQQPIAFLVTIFGVISSAMDQNMEVGKISVQG